MYILILEFFGWMMSENEDDLNTILHKTAPWLENESNEKDWFSFNYATHLNNVKMQFDRDVPR